MNNELRDLRVSHKLAAGDIVAAVRKIFPKYDKTLQSKCENGQEYGIMLLPAGMEAARALVPGASEGRKDRRRDRHRLTCRVHCRLSAGQLGQLQQRMETDGYGTVQDCISDLVKRYLESAIYDSYEAAKAQIGYCEAKGLPRFAPSWGLCPHCGRNIYQPVQHSTGTVTGITVRSAANGLISGCPHCHYSFCD